MGQAIPGAPEAGVPGSITGLEGLAMARCLWTFRGCLDLARESLSSNLFKSGPNLSSLTLVNDYGPADLAHARDLAGVGGNLDEF
jgi:hypothetical protein